MSTQPIASPTDPIEPKRMERVSLAENGWLAETVFNRYVSPQFQFAVYRERKTTTVPHFTLGDWQVVPLEDYENIVRKGFVLLPPSPRPCGSARSLIGNMTAFVNRYADMPEFEAEVCAHYALMTWVFDRFAVLPYLRWLGEAESGKTRKLQTVSHLCYKCICAGGATTVSPMFRLLEDFGGTLMVDEADFRNSDLWAEIIKILNCGYMRGLPVLRSERVGNRYVPTAFDVFGPKLISTRRRFEDHALETRCLTFLTEERKIRRDIPRSLPDKFYEEASALRGMLLEWRFENYWKIKPDESKLLDIKPRLAQLGTPLYSVSKDEGFRSRLVEFLTATDQEQTMERPQAAVVGAVLHLSKTSETLYVKAVASVAGRIAAKMSIDGSFSPKTVGSYIRSLGFKPTRSKEGYRFKVEKKPLDDLADTYGTAMADAADELGELGELPAGSEDEHGAA